MPRITRTVTLPHPRSTVWTALTDPDALADWLMPNDFRPEPGHVFTFRTEPGPGFDGIVRCEVLEIDPPRRLSFTWVAGAVDTRVTFDLEEADGGTRLTLRHEGFELRQLPIRMFLGLGWRRILGRRLPAHLSA